MRRRLAIGCSVVLLLLLVGVAALGVAAVRSGAAEAILAILQEPDGADISDPASFERWVLAHPERFSLVVASAEPDGSLSIDLAWDADRPRALASTQKTIVLLALALAADQGRLDLDATVPRETWESWYLPGVDGGAHPAAVERLGLRPGEDPSLRQLASAMIQGSDNAATDTLLAQVPPGALREALELAPGVDPLHPLLGDVLMMGEDEPCGRSVADLQEPISVLAESFRTASPRREFRVPGVRRQRATVACVGVKGPARSFAALLGQVGVGAGLPEGVVATMREALEWPMENRANRDRFERFGAKGGAMPGVLTDSFYLVPKEGPHAGQTRVVALFLDGLGIGAWLAMSQSFAHQRWMRDLATDPAKVEAVRAALEGGP